MSETDRICATRPPRLAPLVYAPTDIGPRGISRIVAKPGLHRHQALDPALTLQVRSIAAIRYSAPAWSRPCAGCTS
jgi:hypothetical protein